MRKWSPGLVWVGVSLIVIGAALTGVQIAWFDLNLVAVLSKVFLVVLGVALLWQSARNGRGREKAPHSASGVEGAE
ncbi:hypothetical protein JD292_01855 [Leucobacter sp. CSA2]|uniref:Uncharacterized protein n=1 Tax=Leucobacter edaphi TaxID=2796472 RepID=A0A934UXE0_9MICO|nr:hypothetical protein [Leucobacter edaphi]MBK0420827.1 hypothetical protein [Leucobacter edaphi]